MDRISWGRNRQEPPGRRPEPDRTLNQAAPLRPLPDGVTGLDQFRVQRRDRAGRRHSQRPDGNSQLCDVRMQAAEPDELIIEDARQRVCIRN
jgi:hypothetical protein